MASPLRRAISRARSPVPASPPQSLQSAADTLIPPAPTRQNVHVTVRIRPPNATELSRGETEVFEIDSAGHVSLETGFMERNRKPQTEFNFDAVSSGSNNILLFERSVKETVKATMEGYNGTVFAYGQTSSGKTYTMTGTSEMPGVITQAVETVFDYISKCTSKGFLLRVSYMEIYNETVRDLLSPETQDLRIHEDKRRGVYVSPLKEHVVTSPKQVLKAITLGEENRHMGATDWNERSSRSHTIFQMVIESTDKDSADGGGLHLKRYSVGGPKLSGSSVTMSVLNLIDLAGSEKAATSVDRRKEGAFINKSLLTLGSVISKLTDTTGGHVPFRDSKLTRILQNSLSGNARVAVICTISPSAINFEESLNTLKFAARVKKVVTKAQTNQILDDSALIKKYRAEIEELKAQLAVTESKIQASEDLADTVQVGALKNTIEQERAKYLRDHEEWQLTQTALRERIDHLTKLILTNDSLPASKAVVDHKNALQSKDTTAQKLSALESTISQRDAEIASLKSQLQDKNKLLHDGSATLLDTADVGSGALQELEQLNRQLNDTVDEQQHTISVMESENAQSAAAITEHKNIIASLEEKAAAADDKIADFTKEIDALSQEKDTILLEVEKLRQEVTDLRRQKPHAEASDVKMNGHTRTGSGRDFSSSPEYTELSKTIQRQRSRITSLEEELKQSKQIIATQKEQLHRAELLQLEKGGKWARGNVD